MEIKGIIFDKDGTLMDFEAFWVTVSRGAIADILKETNIDADVETVLCCLDVEDGVADINGILAQDPFPIMGRAINDCLAKYGCVLSDEEMTNLTVKAYHGNIKKGIVAPTCKNVVEVMERLKGMGVKLGLVTTDDPYDTEKCLKALGVYDYFDEIYTDDGVLPTKPDPYCGNNFCKKYGLDKAQVVMVGDTLNDVRFAKNMGIKVFCVAKSDKNRKVLEEYADLVMHDISCIFDCIK